MKDHEYLLLKKMLDKNRRHYKKGKIDFPEYIENHLLLINKLKLSITSMEKIDIDYLVAIDLDESIEKFRKGILIVKYNLN
ncbi:hypothetical protein [Chryseobacterium sp. HR92]|jgi:hypothetical protein|uniref:hypothetical protein n=1 Tax=Chryseobacterium sp. HR92 TaxID=3094839 RepID=UPI00388EF984|nr:hypothetical protein SFA27_16990 [Chryseobacterium sp. HR92]